MKPDVDIRFGVIKWFSEEEYTDKALQIRETIRSGDERAVLPDLLLYEVANALRYNPQFNENDVSEALDSILDMGMDIVTPTSEIINSAIELAFRYDITFYDSFYVALAKELEITLITADKKLHNKVKETHFVEFIGEVS
ncbi:MAG: type II toxin-antitoxin system VapC family toxin [Halobacteriota archaeon]